MDEKRILEQQEQILTILKYHTKLLEDLYHKKDASEGINLEQKKAMAARMVGFRQVLEDAVGRDKRPLDVFDKIMTGLVQK